ncbi:MAG: single-stranded-DNA-specific exonuclease RecJ [Acidobacteriota bacterium]|jgi:single-stranded-DNA-specific exonuclease|nr:single-stranded-DNA-specific exonuclease RecJ [Acidobacteriota bacterium]
MKKRWNIKEHNRTEVAELAKSLKISPLVAALLISRGYDYFESAEKFLNPKYEDLHEPFLLKGMKTAVKRILEAVKNKEKILIWGDYDVDGTTGTVVLRKALEILGAETGYHVPHRFTEGYGVNIPALEKAKERGYKLVISVDCGITSFDAVNWATENGLDFIVTDHHLAKDIGNPNALAVVNPNQADCEYPDKNLAGVGVAFKLVHALLRENGREDLVPHFLKVVAIGTIADVMKLTGENRVIVSLGLKDLPKTINYGLKALMEVSDCRSEMTSYHIGFRIAPRINAAGRMDAAKNVVELLEADNFEKAKELAEYLNSKNLERQSVQRKITELALLETEGITEKNFVVVSGEGWHRGVIGLAASKIAEKLNRPTIVLSTENGLAYGSARSIGTYHLLNGLNSCEELFEKFGGHAAAAGMTLKSENIEELQKQLDKHASENLSKEDLIPEIKIDAEVSVKTLGLDLVEDLKQLEPFGQGNPKPVFITKNLFLTDDPWIMKEKHLKLKLSDENGKKFEAVWWDGVEQSDGQTLEPEKRIELAYSPEANTWQGNTRLQLVVKDLRIT